MASARSKRRFSFICCAAPAVNEDDNGVTLPPSLRQTSLAQKPQVPNIVAPEHTSELFALAGTNVNKAAASGTTGRQPSLDFTIPACNSLNSQEIPRQESLPQDISSVMAKSIHRPYTDHDWFAAMAALDAIQMRQSRVSQPLFETHSVKIPSVQEEDTFTEVSETWFSSCSRTVSTASAAFISAADLSEVSALAHEADQRKHQQLQQLTVVPPRELEPPAPSCVPNPPLLFADKNWKYRQVDVKPFCFYWEKDSVRSTPGPLPVDIQLRSSALCQKIHQSIPGTLFQDVKGQLLMQVTPAFSGPLSALTKYVESYNKDQTPSSWALRRDVRVGRTVGQMYMTTDGILILRIMAYGVFSRAVEWIHEDYLRLEEGGGTIVTRQLCKCMADESVQSQFLIGHKAGTAAPARR